MLSSIPKIAKGDQVMLTLAPSLGHGIVHVPAKVVGVGQNGKIDLIAEDLPGHVKHVGHTNEIRIRGRVDPKDGKTTIGGTTFEASEEPRIVLTDSPFDPTGRQPDSWHVAAKAPVVESAPPVTAEVAGTSKGK